MAVIFEVTPTPEGKSACLKTAAELRNFLETGTALFLRGASYMGTARMLCREIHVGLKSDLQSDPWAGFSSTASASTRRCTGSRAAMRGNSCRTKVRPAIRPVGRALARQQGQAQAPGVAQAAKLECREIHVGLKSDLQSDLQSDLWVGL